MYVPTYIIYVFTTLHSISYINGHNNWRMLIRLDCQIGMDKSVLIPRPSY